MLTDIGRRWNANGFGIVTSELIPGVTLKGANIAPKSTHVATGAAYRALFDEWDWADWIKPQVDAVHGIGGNAIRLIGDVQGIADATFSQATYDSRWAQLIDYAASLDMYTYPALSGVSQIAAAGLSIPDLTDILVDTATALDARADHLVGLDLIQESVRRQVAGSYALVYGATLCSAVRAVTDVPLTFSNSDAAAEGSSRFIQRLWRDVLRDVVDYWDIHVYCAPVRTLAAQAFWDQGETKPVLIGEFGSPGSASTDTQNNLYDRIVDLARFHRGGPRIAGAFQWAIFDQGASANAWGMFETNGTARANKTSRFQQLPDTPPAGL